MKRMTQEVVAEGRREGPKERPRGRVRGFLSRLVSREKEVSVQGPPAPELTAAHALWGHVPAFHYVGPEWFGPRDRRRDG